MRQILLGGARPHREAEAAQALLAPYGPVLANVLAAVWHFILEPGAVADGRWDVCGTWLLRAGTRIAIPPPFVVTGQDVRWVVLPGSGRTDPRHLARALAAASGAGTRRPQPDSTVRRPPSERLRRLPAP